MSIFNFMISPSKLMDHSIWPCITVSFDTQLFAKIKNNQHHLSANTLTSTCN